MIESSSFYLTVDNDGIPSQSSNSNKLQIKFQLPRIYSLYDEWYCGLSELDFIARLDNFSTPEDRKIIIYDDKQVKEYLLPVFGADNLNDIVAILNDFSANLPVPLTNCFHLHYDDQILIVFLDVENNFKLSMSIKLQQLFCFEKKIAYEGQIRSRIQATNKNLRPLLTLDCNILDESSISNGISKCLRSLSVGSNWSREPIHANFDSIERHIPMKVKYFHEIYINFEFSENIISSITEATCNLTLHFTQVP